MGLKLDKKEKLIWALLFSDRTEFEINIQDYCTADGRAAFREEIRNIIKTSNIVISDDRIIHADVKVIWKLEIKR